MVYNIKFNIACNNSHVHKRQKRLSPNFAIGYVEACSIWVRCGYKLIEMNGLSPIHWGAGHLAGLRGLRMEGYV